MICAAYGYYNRSDREKKRKFLSSPFPRIKPETKDLAARWLFNIGTGWTVHNYTFSGGPKNCLDHFEVSCFESELQTRLEFLKKMVDCAGYGCYNRNEREMERK